MAASPPQSATHSTPVVPALTPVGAHKGKPSMPLGRAVTVVGSRQRSHLHLVSRSVSKSHALLIHTDAGHYVRDLASRMHVIVNGKAVHEHELRHGDTMQVGSFVFRYDNAKGFNWRTPPAKAAETVLWRGPDHDPLPLVGKTFLIGRRGSTDLSIENEAVSTVHAVIFELNGQRYIRDLGSRTGTFVNGVSIHQTALSLGDTIKIGESELRYVPVGETADLDADLDAGLPAAASAMVVDEPAGESGLNFEPVETPAVVRADAAPPLPLAPEPVVPVIPPAPIAGPTEIAPPTPIETLTPEPEPEEFDLTPIDLAPEPAADAASAPIELEPIALEAEAAPAEQPIVAEAPAAPDDVAAEPIGEVPAVEPEPVDFDLTPTLDEPTEASPLESEAGPIERELLAETPLDLAPHQPVLDASAETEEPAAESEAGPIEREALAAAAAEAPPAPAEPIDAADPGDRLVDGALIAEPPAIPEDAFSDERPVADAFADLAEAAASAESTELLDIEPTPLNLEAAAPSPDVMAAPGEFDLTVDTAADAGVLAPEPESIAEPRAAASEPEPELELPEKAPPPAVMETFVEHDVIEEPELPLELPDEIEEAPSRSAAAMEPEALEFDLPAEPTFEAAKLEAPPLTATPFPRAPAASAAPQPADALDLASLDIDLDRPTTAARGESSPAPDELDLDLEGLVVDEFSDASTAELPHDSALDALTKPQRPTAVEEPDLSLDLPDLAPGLDRAGPPSADRTPDAPAFAEPELSLDLPDEAAAPPPDAASFAQDLADLSPAAEAREAPPMADDLDFDLPPLAEEPDVRPELPAAPAAQAPASQPADMFRGLSSDFSGFIGGMPLSLNEPPAAQRPAPTPSDATAQPGDEFVMDEAGAALDEFERSLAASAEPEPPAPQAAAMAKAAGDAYEDPTEGSLPLPPSIAPGVNEGLSPAAVPSTPKPPPPARAGAKAGRRRESAAAASPVPLDPLSAPVGDESLIGLSHAGPGPLPTSGQMSAFDGLAFGAAGVSAADAFWQAPAGGTDFAFGGQPIAPPQPAAKATGRGAGPGPRGVTPPRPSRAEPPRPVEPSTAEAPVTEDAAGFEPIDVDEEIANAFAEPAKADTGPAARKPGRPISSPGTRLPPTASSLNAARAAAQTATESAGVAVAERSAPARRKRGVAWLLSVMLVVMAVVAAALFFLNQRYKFLAPRADVIGSFPFQKLDGLPESDRRQLVAKERLILQQSAVWETARVKARELDPSIEYGFLALGGQQAANTYLNLAENADIPSGRSAMLIKYSGLDPHGDHLRVLALLKALYDNNRELLDQATKSGIAYDKARDELARIKNEIDSLQHERETLALKLDVDPAIRQRELRKLKDDTERLWKKWGDASAAVQAAQAELEQLEAAVPEGEQGTAAQLVSDAQQGAGGKANHDSQLAEMDQQIADMAQSIAAKKEARQAQAEQARVALDTALAAFDKEIAGAKAAMKGDSELTRYLAAAKRVQDTIKSAHDDLVYQQKEDYARLSELKRRLAEKNEARIKEAWANDADLKAMQQDLAIKERRQSAAASAGMTREADKLKDEATALNKRIDARRDLLVTADVYAPEISSLQQFIEENLKRMEDARARNDQRMRQMLEELSASAPQLASLPAEQKSLAGELEKRSAELNAARENYAAAMKSATATADEQIATLDKELTQLQAKADARKKQIADAARATLTAEQQRSRETATAQTRQRLAAAKEAETAARAEYAASQQKMMELESDTAAIEATRPKYHAAMNKIAELRRVQQDKEAELAGLAKGHDHDAALMPLPPTEASVVVTQTPDRLREAMILALSAVAVVFVFLIGNAWRHAADWEAMAPRAEETPSGADGRFAADPVAPPKSGGRAVTA